MKLTEHAAQGTLMIGFSSLADGSMSKAVDDDERRRNRQEFLRTQGLSLERTVLVHLKYEGSDYCRYYTVDSSLAGEGMAYESNMIADALFTRDHKLALFLPVADCVGAILYDEAKQVLGLAHFGRHNLVQHGGTKAVEYMKAEFGSNPRDIQVWLSPAASRQSYPLYDFNNRSLHEVTLGQLLAAGVPDTNVEIDSRDTAADENLFSHSQFLKGNRKTDGRQAVVVMMK
jgi:copper oxidase (laccase) domain-containing protein